MRSRRERALPLVVTAAGLAAVAGLELAWRRPPAAAAAVAGLFVLASAVFWALRRGRRPRARIVLLGLVAPVVLAVAGGLAVLRAVDRGGAVWLAVTGYDTAPRVTASPLAGATAAGFARAHPEFAFEDGLLRLRKGTYDLTETLVVPRGTILRIDAGVRLRFAAGRSLVSFSPVVAVGTARNPVVFTARRSRLAWGVVAVQASGRSTFRHVSFSHARYAIVDGRTVPGALSVLGGAVTVERSRFADLAGRDALYVRGGSVLIRGNSFANTFKDCLDIDGGSGVVSGNEFVDCGDEGIDLLDARSLDVFDNTIRDRRGGRVAAETGLAELRARNAFGFSEAR